MSMFYRKATIIKKSNYQCFCLCRKFSLFFKKISPPIFSTISLKDLLLKWAIFKVFTEFVMILLLL